MGKKAFKDVHIVLGGLMAIGILRNARVPFGLAVPYVIRPLIWLALAYITVKVFQEHRPAGRQRVTSVLAQVALLASVLQISLSVLFGIIEGFGKSPYSFTFTGILLNLWVVTTELLGTEYSRAWLVNRAARRKKIGIAALFAILYTLITLPLSSIPGMAQDKVQLVRFLGNDALPTLAYNLFCSYLAFLGGPIPALVYRGLILAFTWFCPVLPNLSWGVSALLSTAVPIGGLVLAQSEFLSEARPRKRVFREREKGGNASVVLVAITGMLMIWFAVGLFPIYPSVIATGSMEPEIAVGDIVISMKDPKEIQVGDVIEFYRDEAWIVHRVIEIKNEGGGPLYVTKGDNNPVPDSDLVDPRTVRGRMIAKIPKIGLFSLSLRRMPVPKTAEGE